MTARLLPPVLGPSMKAFDIEMLTRDPIAPDELAPGERRLMSWVVPPFQRGEVWTQDQKRGFIESIFLGLNSTSYVVVSLDWLPGGRRAPRSGWLLDGQQRISAIRDFLAGEFSVFDGVRWNDLDKMQRRRFLMQPFPCCMVDRDTPEATMRDIYERLAYGGSPHAPDQYPNQDAGQDGPSP